MKRSGLLALYKEAVAKTGFQENTKEKGWMPKLGQNDYRSILRHGTHCGTPAMITVSLSGTLMQGTMEAQRYQRKQERFPGIVKIPDILAEGTTGGADYLVQKKEAGQRVLSRYPYSTHEEKKEIARLYYNTMYYFATHPVLFNPSRISSREYFSERIAKYAENKSKKNSFLSESEIEVIGSRLHAAARSVEMRPFFAHFTNTDIIKAGDRYVTSDAAMVLRPEMYGAAFWIWGATMYAWDIHPKEWAKEVRRWIDCFDSCLCAGDGAKIETNLVERMTGMLLADLPLARSPFDRLSRHEIKKAADVARAVLEEVI